MESDNIRYIQPPVVNEPTWNKFIVESDLPEKLFPVRELSRNLWWTWSTHARDLFESIDETIWESCEHNPIVLLEEVSFNRLKELENDEAFLKQMEETYDLYKTYQKEREERPGPQIAYFSMEYGLHDSLKIFSGGLGILAGEAGKRFQCKPDRRRVIVPIWLF